MKHKEGGWPGEIDPTEPADQQKYKKKMYKDATLGFSQATKEMVHGATMANQQAIHQRLKPIDNSTRCILIDDAFKESIIKN